MSKSPILSLGHININTGKCKYFNIHETWEDSTCEVWKCDYGLYKLVFTTGSTPISKEDQVQTFVNDQTGRLMFTGKFITSLKLSEIKTRIPEIVGDHFKTYYKNKVMGYTYK